MSSDALEPAAKLSAAAQHAVAALSDLGADAARIESALGAGALAIAGERRRQVAEEGFSVVRDRELFTTELARASQAYVAAALYAQATGQALGLAPDSWPWPAELFKPSSSPARNLEKAGALLAAELDRIQAAEAAEDGTPQQSGDTPEV